MITSCKDLRRNRFLPWVAVPFVATSVSALFALLGSSPANHTPPPSPLTRLASQHFSLEISPDPVDLGVVGGVESLERTVSLRNAQSGSLTLERVETSCPCVSVSALPLRIGRGEAGTLRVRFDPSSDPDFEGPLCVQLTGFLAGGEIAFRTEVRLRAEYER